jgi:hopene-associated glycosyltransferase HpnB
MESIWERLLLPAFIYFFKMIYPFALASDGASKIAAAAGGFVLLRTRALRSIGGFAALRDAIIDDCTLASRIKSTGAPIWIGLTRDARAIRPYGSLRAIWNMVARTAYTQLKYSPWLLLLCTAALGLTFGVPLWGLLAGSQLVKIGALVGLGAMFASYVPTLRYYRRPAPWVFTLPVAAILFLAMTWTSAFRYLRGERSRWKNRSYARESVL